MEHFIQKWRISTKGQHQASQSPPNLWRKASPSTKKQIGSGWWMKHKSPYIIYYHNKNFQNFLFIPQKYFGSFHGNNKDLDPKPLDVFVPLQLPPSPVPLRQTVARGVRNHPREEECPTPRRDAGGPRAAERAGSGDRRWGLGWMVGP